ncbi:MAG: EI24 domain-containing protein, partial [bacterium]|nr:EI24 domain-containing protein [bacterium]
MSRISDFFAGFRHLGKGFSFLFSHPSLWIWVLIPWTIALLMLAVSWGLFVYYYPDFYQFLLSHVGLGELVRNEGFWAALGFAGLWTLKQILKLFIFLLGLVFLSILAFVAYLILSAPFLDLLAEKVTLLVQGVEAPPFQWGRFFKSLGQTLIVESKKASLFLIFPLLLAVLNFIP